MKRVFFLFAFLIAGSAIAEDLKCTIQDHRIQGSAAVPIELQKGVGMFPIDNRNLLIESVFSPGWTPKARVQIKVVRNFTRREIVQLGFHPENVSATDGYILFKTDLKLEGKLDSLDFGFDTFNVNCTLQ